MANFDWKETEKNLQSVDDKVVLDALTSIKKTTDKSRDKFDKEVVDAIIPQCIDKLEHHDLQARSYALSILAQQYCLGNDHIEPYIADLCRQMDLPNLLDLQQGSPNHKNYTTLHQSMCTLICELQIRHPNKLMPHFKPLAAYLVDCTAHDNRAVATSACDYWARLTMPPVPQAYMDVWVPAVLSRLGKLVPALLRCLIYHEDHLAYLESKTDKGDDADIPSELESYSNLRNFSALGFENICRIFQTEATMKFKPFLQKWINSANWLETEAIILALAAFTEACGTPRDFKDIYPEILTKFIEFYSHPKPLIRSITCFAMQHFINANIKNVKDPFSKMLKSTLNLMFDPHREVQEMAAQSLSALLAYANRDMTPHSQKIISALARADETLQGRARFTYYEAISHLFGRMGTLMEKNDVETLIQPVMTQWKNINLDEVPAAEGDQDQTFVVCQPLCVIATYSKGLFAPYNDSIFEKVIPFVLRSVDKPVSDTNAKEVMTMRIVANTDLLSAMFDGQGKDLKEAAEKHDLVGFVLKVLQAKHFKDEVYQSTLALLGHLCLNCPDGVKAKQSEIMNVLVENLDSANNSMLNNALWSMSHIIANSKTEDISKLLDSKGKVVEILLKNDSDDGVMVNAALVLTALAKHFPDDLREVILMPEVFVKLCVLLQRPFPRNQEKIDIYNNFCAVISPNIKKVSKEGWIQFSVSAAVLDVNDEELISTLRSLLRDARSSLGTTGWNKVSQQMGPQLAISLRKRYKLY